MRREWTPLLSRIRQSKKFAALPDDTVRMFYLLLLAQLDAWGRTYGEPVLVNSEVWPMLGRTPSDVTRCMSACEAVGLIEIHDVQGQVFTLLPDWEEKAGRIGKKDRGKSEWPDPLPNSRIQSGVSPGLPRGESGVTPPTGGVTPPRSSSLALVSDSSSSSRSESDAPAKQERKPPTGPQAELVAHFLAEWARTRPTAPPATLQKKHYIAAANSLKLAKGDLEQAKRRCTNMLERSDDYTFGAASFCELESHWDRYWSNGHANGTRPDRPGDRTRRADGTRAGEYAEPELVSRLKVV